MKPAYTILIALCFSLAFVGCESSGKGSFPRVFVESRMGNMSEMQPITITTNQGDVNIPVNNSPILSEYEFTRVDLVQVELGKALAFRLNNRGQLRLFQATAGNIGGRLVLTVGNEPIGLRRIDGAINEGVFYVFAMVPNSELPELVEQINDSLKLVN